MYKSWYWCFVPQAKKAIEEERKQRVQAEETAKKKDAMQEQLRQKAVQKEVTNAECTGDLPMYLFH